MSPTVHTSRFTICQTHCRSEPRLGERQRDKALRHRLEERARRLVAGRHPPAVQERARRVDGLGGPALHVVHEREYRQAQGADHPAGRPVFSPIIQTCFQPGICVVETSSSSLASEEGDSLSCCTRAVYWQAQDKNLGRERLFSSRSIRTRFAFVLCTF